MKAILMIILLAGSALAQDQAAAARSAAGCGPDNIKFDVKRDKHQHPLAKPEPGKALAYVIQGIAGGTYKVGLDGAWVGANNNLSYFFFPVGPGEHNVCAIMQSRFKARFLFSSAVNFTAEPGKAYYFRLRLHGDHDNNNQSRVILEPMDSAEGQLLIGSTALSSFQIKK